MSKPIQPDRRHLCRRCGDPIPEDQPSPRRKRICRPCNAKYHREWLRAHPEWKRSPEAQERHRERTRQRYQEHRAEINDSARARTLQRKYGLTPDAYETIVAAQDGKCAICRKSPPPGARRLAVDHHHRTGCVRGLLCYRCNMLIGWAREDPAVLDAARLYLNRSPDRE